MLEQEIKLRFDTVEAARHAVSAAGGRLTHVRRLLADQLYDSPDGRLRDRACAIRIRRDGAQSFLTFKGAPLPGPFKAREELETTMGNAEIAAGILNGIGLVPWFRAEKYREEYAIGDATIAIDEAPIGVFVEIEGNAEAIAGVAEALGRSPADYLTASYRRLYVDWCAARGVTVTDMVF